LIYFICYKHQRLLGPYSSKDEAVAELFSLRGTFKGLYIEIVDPETNRRIGTIGLTRRKKKR
jgi:hypothetical protein